MQNYKKQAGNGGYLFNKEKIEPERRLLKKMKRLSVLLALVLVLSFAAGASAQDLEFFGGVTYNTYAGTLDGNEVSEWKSGVGFFGEGIYWIKEDYGIGFLCEYFTTEKDSYDAWVKIFTPYASLVYRMNDQLRLRAAIGYNNIQYYNGTTPGDKGSGIGFRLGGEFDIPLNTQFNLKGVADYRYAKPEVDGGPAIDMSGFSVGLGISFDL